MTNLPEQFPRPGEKILVVDKKPVTWEDLLERGVITGRTPRETAQRLKHLVEDGVLVKDEEGGYKPTELASALGVELWLMRIAKAKHLARIDDIPEKLQMKVVEGYGFKTKGEVVTLLVEYAERMKRRKEGTGLGTGH